VTTVVNSETAAAEALKGVMRCYPQGVTVLTIVTEGAPLGMTVSAFTSLSLDPALVLVCIQKSISKYKEFTAAESFAVNILGEDQKSISENFGGKISFSDRFIGIKYSAGANGAPILDGVLGVIECEKSVTIDGGDHTIVIGLVTKAQQFSDKRPLVSHRQGYTTTA